MKLGRPTQFEHVVLWVEYMYFSLQNPADGTIILLSLHFAIDCRSINSYPIDITCVEDLGIFS